MTASSLIVFQPMLVKGHVNLWLFSSSRESLEHLSVDGGFPSVHGEPHLYCAT